MRHAIAGISVALGTLFLLAASTPGTEAQETTRADARRPSPDSAALEKGRRLTGWLLDGHADSISARLSASYREEMGGPEAVRQAVRMIRTQLGREDSVVREEVFTRRAEDHYYRIARYEGAPERTITVHWGWRADGRVVYVRVRPTPRPADTGKEDYRTKTDLRLPFRGEWYVFWGGRAPRRNHHVRAPTQRFAYDFLVLEDSVSHTGDGEENEDYHCFGRPVLAPAPGRVATVVDSVPDNDPGEMNREAPAGNHVVVDHGDGEHSLLAHLRRGSVAVAEGDSVERGQRLGACGNSGHSSEPHLHYHLQTKPGFGEGVGLPAQFRDYVADGRPVERGEPIRGQIVRPQR